MTKTEAGIIVKLFVRLSPPSNGDHHPKGAQIHQPIGHQIVHQSRAAQLLTGNHGDEEIAGVGNA